MDLIILKQRQATRTIPEQAHPSPDFHTTPMGRRSSSQQIERVSLFYTNANLSNGPEETNFNPPVSRGLVHLLRQALQMSLFWEYPTSMGLQRY
ncbi:hypothetical protein TNCV_2871691 [Trichonephila clavipes]|nr:hypothetical protein TNCV_2871691 [Trichonephila clavipes]